MRGYEMIMMDATRQIKAVGAMRPIHIFMQTGTGPLTGGVAGRLRSPVEAVSQE